MEHLYNVVPHHAVDVDMFCPLSEERFVEGFHVHGKTKREP